MNLKRLGLCQVLALIAIIGSPSVRGADREADLLITGAQVYTLDLDRCAIHRARETHTIANGQLVFSEGGSP